MQNVVFQPHTSQLANACTIITSIHIAKYINNYIKISQILPKKKLYRYKNINKLSVADLSHSGTCQRLTNP